MPYGPYFGGEMRLEYRRESGAHPHIFELPWFPTRGGRGLQDEFDQQCGLISRWIREHLAEGQWRVEGDGMQVRSYNLVDDPESVTEMRLRWT